MNKILILLFLLLLTAAGGVGYIGGASYLLDRDGPEIEIIDSPKALSKEPFPLKIKLTDESSGLSGYSLRVIYRNKLNDILKKSFNGEKSLEETVLVDLTKFNFPQGAIEFELRVFDRSFFSNFSIKKFSATIDYDAPQIKAVSAQHNTMSGGVEPVFYQVTDKFLASSGVEQGGKFYQGYPARLVDINFRDPNLFIVFFSINPEDQSAPRLVAMDQSGNKSTAGFTFNLMPRKFGLQKIKVDQAFLDIILKATNSQSFTEAAKNYSDLAAREQTQINQALNKATSGKMLWSGSFLQAEGVVNFAFHDNLKLSFESQDFMDFKYPGFFLNTKTDHPVLSLQRGEVIFVGDMALRGKVVILNHGLGVSTLYSHLQEALVEVGQTVEKGLEIGLSGQTGLARKLGYGIEILISGNQINPLNWWDQKWYDGHIEEKILEIKRLYNIPVLEKYTDKR